MSKQRCGVGSSREEAHALVYGPICAAAYNDGSIVDRGSELGPSGSEAVREGAERCLRGRRAGAPKRALNAPYARHPRYEALRRKIAEKEGSSASAEQLH